MLEKPDIPEIFIISRLQYEYGLEVTDVTFLPLGYDMHTAIYRVDTRESTPYFLKLRKGPFDEIIVAVPRFLNNLGIKSIIPPLETQKGELFGNLTGMGENIKLILYPFIPGKNGYQMRLADQHWVELGRILKMVHTAQVPPDLRKLIPREAYDPQWREKVKQFQVQVETVTFTDPIAEMLSIFMKGKHQEISHMVRRAEELALFLQHHSMDFTLCHSDAHPGNYLFADSGEIYLVDWDNPIFAPKERDLMFFGSGMSGDLPGGREECLFYEGYDMVEVNQAALAYYRYERIIQDIAEFCTQLLLSQKGGPDRQQSYKYFVSSFSPGSVVEAVIRTDQGLEIR